MAGNRGFGDALADSYSADRKSPLRTSLPTDAVLASRSVALGELASGKLVTERTLWVSAAQCRPWTHHNRDQALLTEGSCSDLIDSFKAEGRQRLPAIVRRLKDDPDFEFEIIAGVRRHWTVRWLNAHNYPDFQFLVTVQILTDEEAFRLADVENRARRDLTDLERARDYLKALGLFYGGRQKEMAERLHVDTAWLSRLLELARLPEGIVAAFGNPRLLRVEHAKQLAPLLRTAPGARRALAAADVLAGSQAAALASGVVLVRPSEVVRQLQHAVEPPPIKPKRSSGPAMSSAAMRPMLRARTRRGGGMVLELMAGSGASREELKAAFAALLDQYGAEKPFG